MNNRENALHYQSSKIEEILEKQETYRKGLIHNWLDYILIALAISFVFGAYFLKYKSDQDGPIWLVVMFLSLSIIFITDHYTDKNKRIYKQELIPLLAQTLLEHLRMSDTDEIHYQELYEADIDLYKTNPLLKKGDYISSEDLFYGQLGKTKFSFYETLYQVSPKQKEEPFFHGLTFVADFNKNFNGLTTISVGKPDGLSFFDSSNNLKKITLEANDFSKKFDVYSTDGQEARYIISTAFMERIMQLSNASKKLREKHVSILFRNSCMEVYLPNTDDHFEPNLFSKTKIEDVNADFETMELLLSLISVMQLNTRIWTKE